MKTAIAYLRLSYRLVNGELIEEDRDGISRQRRDIKQLAEHYGAELREEDIFFEDDTSASKVRDIDTEWYRCVETFRARRPDYLLGAAADRLSRRLSDLEMLDDICRATGSRVITLKEGDYFSSPAWPFLAAMAKVEALNTAIRVRRAQLARRMVGKDSIGGNRPYGYTVNRMNVIEEEAKIVREVVDRLLTGESSHAIKNDLNRREVSPVTPGKPWSLIMVRRMAANPRYAGFLVHKGEVQGKAAWPAIISEAEHHGVVAALQTTAKPREGRPVTSLLGGIVRCGVCNAPLWATQSGRNNTPVYRCGGCGRRARGRETVDGYVVGWLAEHAFQDIDEAEFNRAYDELEAVCESSKVDDLAAELEIGTLREAYAEGRIEARDYFTDLDMWRRRQRVADKAYGEAVRKQRELIRAREQQSNARAAWDSWTVDQQREFIRSKVIAVMIRPNGKRGPNRPLEPGEIEIIQA